MNCILVSGSTGTTTIENYIPHLEKLSLKGKCSDYASAKKILARQEIQVVFIEHVIAGGDITDFVNSITGAQKVVIISTIPEFSLVAFELGVADFLPGTFSFERFKICINRLVKHFYPAEFKTIADQREDYFFVKSENKYEKINRNDILYIEGLQNYIIIQTNHKKVITYSSLKSIENFLREGEFLRVQKSFIVSVSKIDSINSDDITIGEMVIPISRSIRENVLKTILHNRVYKYQC